MTELDASVLTTTKSSGGHWKLLTLLAVLLAVLYQFEVRQDLWTVRNSVRLKAKLDDAVNFVTATDYMSKWFPFASHIREADGRPLGLDKKYYAIYDIPFWGEVKVLYRVVEFQHLTRIVVEGDSVLRPRLEFLFYPLEVEESRLAISISYQRKSLLFQYCLGPVIYFVTSQRLQHSLFVLRMMTPF